MPCVIDEGNGTRRYELKGPAEMVDKARIVDDRGFGGLRTDREHESNRKGPGAHANPPLAGPHQAVENGPDDFGPKTNPTQKMSSRFNEATFRGVGAGLRAQTQIFVRKRTQ